MSKKKKKVDKLIDNKDQIENGENDVVETEIVDKDDKSPEEVEKTDKVEKKDDEAQKDEPNDEVVNSKKKIKSNKSMSKKKKGIIAIVVTLCIVAITLSIVLPVVFYQKPRIFVKNAEQFVAGNKVGNIDKYFYVLDKNINCDESLTIEGEDVYSIDMNKHSLTVNGDFAINSNREGTMYIGTRKSENEYTSKKASIKANNITIYAPNMDVVIMADISCENFRIEAKSLQVGSFMKGEVSNMNMSIEAAKVKFSGNISGTATSVINVIKAEEVVVDSGVSITNTLQLFGSNLTVNSGATLATVELDSASKAYISGTISNSIIGGAQVNMQDGHYCNTYQDINTLVIFRNIRTSHLIKNCKNVIYVEKLVKPVDINIQEANNRVYCNVASVKHASGYRFYINDEEVAVQKGEDNTRLDITDYVKDIGTYSIKVVPCGDFNQNSDLTNVGHRTMYVDGEAASISYNCALTLQAPQNLRFRDKFILEFDKVLHADYYLIFVDGIMVIRDDIAANSEDLSNYIGVVGDHSIRVQAFSFNENISASSESMTSYSTTEALEGVDQEHLNATFKVENIDGKDVITAINVNWQGTANGYEYIVYLQINGDPSRKIEVGRTSVVDETGAIVYTINFDELPSSFDINDDPNSGDYFDVSIVAAEHDYFTQSAESFCRVRLLQVIPSSK